MKILTISGAGLVGIYGGMYKYLSTSIVATNHVVPLVLLDSFKYFTHFPHIFTSYWNLSKQKLLMFGYLLSTT